MAATAMCWMQAKSKYEYEPFWLSLTPSRVCVHGAYIQQNDNLYPRIKFPSVDSGMHAVSISCIRKRFRAKTSV